MFYFTKEKAHFLDKSESAFSAERVGGGVSYESDPERRLSWDVGLLYNQTSS